MNRCIVAAALVLSIVLVAGSGCTSGTATVSSATPEEAFDTMREAGKNKDWGTFLGCMTPQARDKIAGMMVVAGAMMSAGPPEGMQMPPGMEEELKKMEKAGEDIKAVFGRYGISDEMLSEVDVQTMADESKIAEVGAKVSNQAAFVGEMSAIMEEVAGPGGPATDIQDATISDVTIDGDSATGKVKLASGESAIDFKKIDGNWLVEIPTPGG